MNAFRTWMIASFVATFSLLPWVMSSHSSGQEDEQSDADSDHFWTRALEDRTKRGTLHDQLQNVRGDTGKWSDAPWLRRLPPIEQKPDNLALDDWAARVRAQDVRLTADDDNWLLFGTQQLDDNDRVWVESIERQGNAFTVVANQAIWQGNYRKNFTYHALLGINLGRLEPGDYEARWVLKPLEFNRFEDPGTPRDNWPKDERDAQAEPTEMKVAFTIVAAE